MARADTSGNTLNYRETQIVKGMLARGDRQHDIAAYFSVNAGRIAEVATGACAYPDAPPTKPEDLPPPGPYMTKFALQQVIDTVSDAIAALELAENESEIADVRAAMVLAKEILVNKLKAIKEV